jgi:ABC-type multidrug transport system fused ATPase/permease subunit
LLKLSLPDAPLLAVAFVFLVMYAISAASVPHFTGLLIDAVAIDRNRSAFSAYAKYLLLAAVCSGVFAGARGSIFTVQMARLNARVRQRLFDSLLTQNGGFFDEHKTGDLSSRLNNDCSTIANLLSLNINVASRNFVNVRVVFPKSRHTVRPESGRLFTHTSYEQCETLTLVFYNHRPWA